MARLALLVSALVLAALTSAQLAAQTPTSAAPQPGPQQPKNDYADPLSWLCRPGRQDACAVDLTTTVVAADGTTTIEKWAPNPNAGIDCFYVYPTVSLDPAGNSDMNPGAEERRVVQVQFARFASQCRVFAPMYRQATLTQLRSNAAGKPMAVDRMLPYSDVADAWQHYLANDNRERGVVLIGHSQGAGVLGRLIREEIDGKPIQSRIVSALLLGANVGVPRAKDVGGMFKSMPLCRTAQQTGCVISYVTFRSTIPPPADSRFGLLREDGTEVACTNPAALAGGAGDLRAYFVAAGPSLIGSATEQPFWVKGAPPVNTPYVSVPGLLSARCVSTDAASYLEVTVNANPTDPRTDDITGDILTNGKVNATWGLHLIDVQLAIGNLVEIVGQQGRAYAAKSTRR